MDEPASTELDVVIGSGTLVDVSKVVDVITELKDVLLHFPLKAAPLRTVP